MIIIDKFYTCKNDRAFKEVFMKEDNKDILKALLESILKVEINDIEYLNLEKNVDNVNVRRKHFDLHLSTNIGSIQVEVNSELKPYTRNRNAAFIFDTYSHVVLKGEEYTDDKLVVQINFTYGLSLNEKDLRIYKLMDEDSKEFVCNLLIYEFNMDYYHKLWYSKDNEKIEDYKYLIMQDLNLEDLRKLSKKDKVVYKYMSELERVNEDPKFREYMSAEEDNRKIENSIKYYARIEGIEEGKIEGKIEGLKEGKIEGMKENSIEIAKKMKSDNISLEDIMKYTNLTIEEIEKL